MAEPIAVTDEDFETEVIQADLPTLVDFWAAWCGPCRLIAPVVEEIAEEYDGRLRVVKLDVDANPNTVMRFGIMGIPTLMLFKGGEVVERVMGFKRKPALAETIAPHLE